MEASIRSAPGLTWIARLTSRIIIAGCLAATSLSGLSGCSTAGKQASHNGADHGVATGARGSEVMGPPEPYGPPTPPSADTPNNTYGPEPILFRPVVLVLGPGLARGYAYVGAIRALNEAKIPIGAVLGTEMGALVGSLYAMDAKINQFEWAMLKFREGAFEKENSLLPSVFRKSAKSKKLQASLESIFDKRGLDQSKLPLRVAIEIKESGATAVLERGSAVAAVRAAVADPELFDPGEWDGKPAVSAAKVRPFLISEARALNLGPVVVIDAMDANEEKQFASAAELKDADLVIRPDLHGIGPLDFQKRTDAAFRGKKAISGQIAEIRHLVGMPAEADPKKGNP